MNRASNALVAGLLTVWISPWALARQAASLQEILDAVERQRASIHNIQVSVWQHTTAPMPGAMRSEHYTLILDGGRYFMEHRYDSDAGSFFVASVHNGDHGIVYQEKTKMARISTAIDRDFFHTNGSGFFDLMMYFPEGDGRPASGPGPDLENMLRTQGAVLQPDSAELEGVRCQIVDMLRSDQSVAMRLWLDPARGFFPLKQEVYGKGGALVVENLTTRLAQVEGVWIPVEGRHRVPPQPDIGPFPIEVIIEVDVDAAGQPVVALNQRIDASKFDYRDQLPPGTLLSNDSGEIIEVVGQKNTPANTKPFKPDASNDQAAAGEAASDEPPGARAADASLGDHPATASPPISAVFPAAGSTSMLLPVLAALAAAALLLVAVVVFRRR